MNLKKCEMETTIVKTAEDKEWMVYSSDPKYIRKMNKIGMRPYKVDKIDGEVVGSYYKIDEKQISFRKKRVLSEEQKKVLSERMKNIRSDNK
ncbi:TPA: hypothetical protein ACF2DD_002045 [Clostridium perfringens]|uniref:hypothetical protein n=1 Tax=Clostridium perfringens TaxID=1502 RepID=UPI00367F2182